jgi:hypothetical protein
MTLIRERADVSRRTGTAPVRYLLVLAAAVGSAACGARAADAPSGGAGAPSPAGVAALPALAPDVERRIRDLPAFRWNNAHLTLPADWKKGLSDKSRYLIQHEARLKGVAGNPRTERVEIEIARANPILPGDLRAIYKLDVADFKKRYKNYRDERVTEGRTKHGNRTLTHSFTVDSDWQEAWGDYHYVITHVDGGDWAQSFIYLTSTPAFRDRFRKAFDDLVDGVVLPSTIRLARPPYFGPAADRRPLDLFTVYQMTDFLEWLLELPLTEGQKVQIRDYLVTAWQIGDTDSIDAPDEVLRFRSELDALDPKKKELARQLVRQEALKEWRKEAAEQNDPAARMIVELYDAANAPLAKGSAGEPDLTRQSADATLEIMYFMASKIDGIDTAPEAGHRAEWATKMAAAYAAMSAEQKQALAEMPVTWAALRAGWAELPADQRKQSADQWAQIPALKELAGRIKHDREAFGKAYQRYAMDQQMKVISAGIMRRTDYFRQQTMNNMSSSYSYRYR